jgi:hypothetical protein
MLFYYRIRLTYDFNLYYCVDRLQVKPSLLSDVYRWRGDGMSCRTTYLQLLSGPRTCVTLRP